MTRRTSRKPVRKNSRRRTSRRLRANFGAEIGAQIRETIDGLRAHASDLQDKANDIADAWREKDLEDLRGLDAISAQQYKMLVRERDQA